MQNIHDIAPEVEHGVKAAFNKFLAIQNANDINAMSEFMLNSPTFTWVTGGTTKLGRGAAIQGLAEFYRGTWSIDPKKLKALKIVMPSPDMAFLHVIAELHIGPLGQDPKDVPYYLNLTFVRAEHGWKLAAIIPIRVPV